jgi:hypothetical protein
MRNIYMTCLVACLILVSSCKKFLDVNENPNAPQDVTANLYLAPMLHWMVTDAAYEGRHIGRYTQNWTLPATTLGTWDRMGYDPGSDNGAQTFRDVYWSLGKNLIDMMTKAEAQERWDLLGVGYILKAWGWQTLTDLHGEITIKEAFLPNKVEFAYDSQEFAYEEVRRLLGLAISNLQRTDGAVDKTFLAVGDKIYNGDREKWLKYAYGLLAINLSHYSNKAAYDPDAVIAAVDKSFASNADDALLPYGKLANDDSNFMGPRRQNFQNYRQTQFIVNLMNGAEFGNVVDPRMTRILAPAPDGVYRGLDINVANYGALTTAQRPNNIWGSAANIGVGVPTIYLFDDVSKFPAMTYAQLQFIKAEAAYKKGDKTLALDSYRNAISSHIDFVNARNSDNAQIPTQITSSEKTAFLSNTAIVPALPTELTLSHIMSQKYIAQWGWGHYETWMDLRRYHYTDVDPAANGEQIFRGFAVPTSLYGDNGGKVVQRVRLRYNSEYVWNRANLDKIGGLAADFHTVPLWITQP